MPADPATPVPEPIYTFTEIFGEGAERFFLGSPPQAGDVLELVCTFAEPGKYNIQLRVKEEQHAS